MHTNPTPEELLQRIHELEGELRECTHAKEEASRSREALTDITRGMYEGFVVINAEYRIQEVNDRYLDYYGHPREEVIGATCYEITHRLAEPCPDQERICPAKAVFDSGAPIRVKHDRSGCQNGQRAFEIYAFPLFGQDGTVKHVVEISHDVTDRKRAEDERVQRENLEAVLETAGTVRHELNQPMQALMYCEQMLMSVEQDNPLYQPIQQIIENIDRMAAITRRLSYVERVEAKDHILGTRGIDIDRSSRSGEE
jgi:PAS domain S-box-containing protein